MTHFSDFYLRNHAKTKSRGNFKIPTAVYFRTCHIPNGNTTKPCEAPVFRDLCSAKQNYYPYAPKHVRNNIRAGLLTHILYASWRPSHALPSQFPNDRLSPTSIKHSDVYSDWYRRGFSPRSLFTDYALAKSPFTAQPTLCVIY